MSAEDDALEERARVAGEMLEWSLMMAVGTVEAELSRVMRTGEADLERLAAMVLEVVDRLSRASEGGAPNSSGGGAEAGSANQIATTVARAVRRGARFS